ncbi:MAG TPA: hypothetical protein VHL30_03790 [Chlamydiales bacterium]|jgi:hypothetical protein|nr:hypothetical protein [Chlamydiales bacterium]
MVRRVKKTPKRVVKKKKAPAKKAMTANQKAQWSAYKELQQQVDKAWARLKEDVKKKAKSQTIVRDKNELLLLLGECNYMAREYMRLSAKKKSK